jgi:hypothetical protein
MVMKVAGPETAERTVFAAGGKTVPARACPLTIDAIKRMSATLTANAVEILSG